jgi:glutamate N-acetyltransferase/amino-acid N-acetyltransferase
MQIQSTVIPGGVAAPAGFRAAGVACGIKKTGLDVAVVASDRPATAAGVFTTNRTVAAPVIVSRDHLARSGGRARGIAINSGCANACTGPAGLNVARAMADALARCLDVDSDEVLIASTGVIGVALDPGRVTQGIT